MEFLKVVFAVLMAAACQIYAGRATDMGAIPETFIAGVTPNLTLKCTPGDTIAVVSTIVVFQLSKDGTLLATGKPDQVVLSESLRTNKYSATRQIDMQNMNNSFMLFTIQFPEAEDEGTYSCHMNYEDKDGFFQNADCTLTLKQNATDDINVQTQLEQTVQVVDNLMARIKVLEAQVFDLTTDTTNQSKRIGALVKKASNHVGFFATLSHLVSISTDDVILFDEVIFNTGNSFNHTSGVFLAPMSGFYVLNLVCEVQAAVGIRMEILLKVEDKTIMKLYVSGESSAHGGQQSGSLVYDLTAGSQVKVVVGNIQTESSSSTNVQLMSEKLSYFSGYFLG